MTFSFRFVAILPFVAAILLTAPCRAAVADDVVLTDSASLASLEARAAAASPREQCFLYAELVHNMTVAAGREMLDGETGRASETLKRVEHYATLIHMGLAKDTRRLKSAEMLMHNTTYRLSGFLHAASTEDKATLEATLKHLDTVQNELLNQVFSH